MSAQAQLAAARCFLFVMALTSVGVALASHVR